MKSFESFHLDGAIRSELLGELRKIEWLRSTLGALAQFTIVVDANIILGDLLWLVKKRRNPDAVTELMECISAGTITAYISRSVLNEVTKHIPSIAKQKNLPEDELNAEWKTYRKLLKVRTPRKSLIDKYAKGQDPDDAPTLALADMIRACGILSKDSDIVAMGGIVIELSFTQIARDYSRKTAIRAAIQFTGTSGIIVAGLAVKVAADSLIWLTQSMPKPVLLLFFVAALAILADQKSREKVIALLQPLTASISENSPIVLDFLARLGSTLAENYTPAPEIRLQPPINRGSSA